MSYIDSTMTMPVQTIVSHPTIKIARYAKNYQYGRLFDINNG